MNLRITGPPGTGKSTEAWAWALWKARTGKKTINWFHFTKSKKFKVVIDQNQIVRYNVSNGDLAMLIVIFWLWMGLQQRIAISSCLSW